MRTSIASATFLLLGAGAVAVAAADTNGNNLQLTGSDTLFTVTQNIITSCDGAIHGTGANAGVSSGTLTTAMGISYLGGGSGVGAGNMNAGNQQLAPMSRALKNTEYCTTDVSSTAFSSQGTTNGILLGVDGLSIMANTAQSCGPDLAQNGRVLPVTGGSIANYTITNSLQVLRLLYAGTDNGATGTYTGDYGCGGPIRKSLVANWSKLFKVDCAAGKCDGTNGQPMGITHAWRRSDLSGTTDAFVTLVNMGSRKIGNNPITQAASGSYTVNPFCNSIDATTPATATTCTKTSDCQVAGDTFTDLFDFVCEAGKCHAASLGSYADYTDKDPIRLDCDFNPTTGDDTDVVCGADGKLGVVLPILLPDSGSSVTATDSYPTALCDATNTCGLSKTGDPSLPCPRNGPKKLGACFQPAIRNPDGSLNFNCIATSSSKCAFDQGVDGRAYNLPLKKKAGAQGAQYVGDGNNNLMTGSFFRIHMTAPSSYAAAGAPTCQFGDDTHQIGCLVGSDPCSVGYAGREADQVGGAINQALSVQAAAGLPGILPRPDSNISQLLDGVGKCPATACAAGFTCNPQFGQCYPNADTVYPLSRRLYIASLVGMGNLQGGEKQLAQCFGDNNLLTPAIQNNNFVLAPGGAKCLDYPEKDSSLAVTGFLPNCTSATSGGANTDACTGAAAPLITHNTGL
jgi:hypothetical protein